MVLFTQKRLNWLLILAGIVVVLLAINTFAPIQAVAIFKPSIEVEIVGIIDPANHIIGWHRSGHGEMRHNHDDGYNNATRAEIILDNRTYFSDITMLGNAGNSEEGPSFMIGKVNLSWNEMPSLMAIRLMDRQNVIVAVLPADYWRGYVPSAMPWCDSNGLTLNSWSEVVFLDCYPYSRNSNNGLVRKYCDFLKSHNITAS